LSHAALLFSCGSLFFGRPSRAFDVVTGRPPSAPVPAETTERQGNLWALAILEARNSLDYRSLPPQADGWSVTNRRPCVHWIRLYIAFQQHCRPRDLCEGRCEPIPPHVPSGYGRVELPHALARKYSSADREWPWQFVFPQERRWRNPATGQQCRHHIDES